ncbi:MAG: citrulline utilization hydrolase CtlX, partial [Gammaproteobacteria bacterium]
MVRPHRFGPNEQTAASNALQKPTAMSPGELHERALTEFDAMVGTLRGAGVNVTVFEDTDEPAKPDAVFPNNWISLHADGRVFLYPLEAVARRAERRTDIVESLSTERGFRVTDIVDLSSLESRSLFLESTGSMVLDRVNHVAYAALSSRTHIDALGDFAHRADYEIVAFDARDTAGAAIYHTNVMMALGSAFAVICADAIGDRDKRDVILAKLAADGREVIEISQEQVGCFAGNLLEVENDSGDPIVVLSDTALDSLTDAQRERIAGCGRLLPIDVRTIEHVGGGSVRCMLAEVFLPRTR